MSGTGPVVGTSSVSLTIQVQEPSAAPMFFMAEDDWDRFGRYLKGIGSLPAAARDAYLVWLGIAGGGVFSIATWGVPFFQQSQHDLGSIVQGVLLVGLTVIAASQALVNRRLDKDLQSKVRRDASLLYDDMHACHPFSAHDDPAPK